MTKAEKKCTKCGCVKPHSAYSKDASKTDGLRPDCKECRSLHYKNNSERILADVRAYQANNASEIREKKRKHYSLNRDRMLAEKAAYYAKAKEKIKDMGRKYRLCNVEKIRIRRAEYRKANIKQILIRNKNRKFSQANRGKLSTGLVEKLLILQKGKCACCGEKLNGDFHIDHIVPIALGGLNVDSNIQLLRPLCNLQKNAKHPVEFMQSRGFLL